MDKIRFLLAFALLVGGVLFPRGPASAQPVTIAILDSPVDLDHPDIAAALQLGFLEKTVAEIRQGKTVSWADINREAHENFEKAKDGESFKLAIRLIRLSESDRDGGRRKKRSDPPPTDPAAITDKALENGALRFRYQTDATFRAQVELANRYIHGTHVAGIAVRGLSDVRLIPFPQLAPPVISADFEVELDPNLSPEEALAKLRDYNRKRIERILSLDPAREAGNSARFYSAVSQTLKTQGVKVLNASLGFSPGPQVEIWKMMIGDPTLWQEFDERLIKKAIRLTQAHREQFEKLVLENPQTLFVIPAGNDHKFLGRAGVSVMTKMNAENLLTVAAVDREGNLAHFSNYDGQVIDIAANGVGVWSALAGGGKIALSGVSMAAPAVTNLVARIFEHFPLFTPRQTIGRLFRDHSVSNPRLDQAVEMQRMLRPHLDRFSRKSACTDLFN